MKLITFIALTVLILSFWFRDAKVKKVILTTFAVLFLLIILVSLIAWSMLRDRRLYMESFEQYSPTSCPNTLWTCTDGDIYFASDENGETWGASRIDGVITCYRIYFKYSQGEGFDVSELESLSVEEIKSWPFCFRGGASYSEDSCTIVYQADDDTEHYFGEREGEVTLTFIKSDLSAPFSFDSEECLNELPFR